MKKVFLKIISTGERNPCARKSIRIDLSGYHFSDFKWWWLKKRITRIGRGERKLGEFSFLHWIDSCSAKAEVQTCPSGGGGGGGRTKQKTKPKKLHHQLQVSRPTRTSFRIICFIPYVFKLCKSWTKSLFKKTFYIPGAIKPGHNRWSLCFIPTQESTTLFTDHETSQTNTLLIQVTGPLIDSLKP